MQKVIVQIDWYTKIILTLIAVLLAGILAKPHVATRPVEAVAVEASYPTPSRMGALNMSGLPMVVVDWKETETFTELTMQRLLNIGYQAEDIDKIESGIWPWRVLERG